MAERTLQVLFRRQAVDDAGSTDHKLSQPVALPEERQNVMKQDAVAVEEPDQLWIRWSCESLEEVQRLVRIGAVVQQCQNNRKRIISEAQAELVQIAARAIRIAKE